MPDADGKGYCDSDASLVSYIPKTNLRTLMSPEDPTNTAAGIMTVKETTADGRECETLTVFENVFPEESREWAETKRGSRGEAYAAYKAERTRQLLQKACEVLPGLENRLNIVATASQLTYRDYLSPYGSAFGIRQKAGQHNLFGRLPVRNCYAIGQNALLPGVFGAMQSAFIIWRKLIGEEKYSEQFNAFHRKRRGYKA
jgi:phytoene dehydrogenase-like protein